MPGTGTATSVLGPRTAWARLLRSLIPTFVARQPVLHQDLSQWLPSPGLRVLLADDCPINQLLARIQLAQWGIVPTLAADGQIAVQLAASHRFDIILMDTQMPVMSGLAAACRIRAIEGARAQPRAVTIVAYGRIDKRTVRDQIKRGIIQDALSKPSTNDAMRNCLQRWCGGESAMRWPSGTAPRRPVTHSTS